MTRIPVPGTPVRGSRSGSAIIDYLGHDLVSLRDEAAVSSATLDMAGLAKFREKFPFHVDADAFSL